MVARCFKLEDLKVLRRSPDLFNYVKIGQGQLHHTLFYVLLAHITHFSTYYLHTSHTFLCITCPHHTLFYVLLAHITHFSTYYLHTSHTFLLITCTHHTLFYLLLAHITHFSTYNLPTSHTFLLITCPHHTLFYLLLAHFTHFSTYYLCTLHTFLCILRDFKNSPFYIFCLFHMIELRMFSLLFFILFQNGP